MLSFVDLGSAAPRVCVMCQNISGWLTIDCLIIYNVLPIVSHIFFRQKSTTFAYVLEVTVTLSPFAQTSFANPVLYHEVYFLSFDFFIYSVCLQCFIQLYNICVCHLFNKEISINFDVQIFCK